MNTLTRIRPATFLVLFVLLAGLSLAPPAHAVPCSDQPIVRTHVRDVEAWYGSAFVGSAAVASALELTDHVSDYLRFQIVTIRIPPTRV